MENILFEFYHGNINPSDGKRPKGEEYKKATKQFCYTEKALLEHIDHTGQELYHQLTHAIITVNSIENAQAFSDALKLGARIMFEILQEDN